MKIKVADGQVIDLSAAQAKTLRAAARKQLRYCPPRDWAAPSLRTRFMFEIDGQRGKATTPGAALYRSPLELIDLATTAEHCTATVTARGWLVLDAMNAGKWTVHSFNPETGGLVFQDWGVLATEADAVKLATWMATQWSKETSWTYGAAPITAGTEPKQPHELWLSKAGVVEAYRR
jgi:hypothetical protein